MEEEHLHILLEEQINDVQNEFCNLCLKRTESGQYCVNGILEFKGEYNQKIIFDAYNIEILIPKDYPKILPRTRSVDGKIPEVFHTYPEEKTFCLGAPLAEKLIFFEKPDLINYIKKLLIPYLFSYSYLQEYGELPYGDLGHGAPGILSFYKELFGIDNDLTVLGILTFLTNGKYRGHLLCPCGSNTKLRDCHGPLICKIMKYHSLKEFEYDHAMIFTSLEKQHSNNSLFVQYIPNRIKKLIRKSNKS